MPPRPDLDPITSPEDPRLAGMGREEVAGQDQISDLLARSPQQRLQYLLETLAFEDRLRRARRISREK